MYKNYYGRSYRYSSSGDVDASATTHQQTQVPSQLITTVEATSTTTWPLTLQQQLRTIFIGNLPEGIPDKLFQQAFKQIPGLEIWVRFPRANGKLTNYGFAVYATVGAVKVALDVLPKIKLRNGNLSVNAEENTHRWIQSKGKITAQSVARKSESDLEKIITTTFTNWLESHPDYQEEEQEEDIIKDAVINSEDGDVVPLYKQSLRRHDVKGLAADEKDGVYDEIIRFREQSLRLEKARLAEDFDYEKTAAALEQDSEREDNSDSEYDFSSGDDDTDASDEELFRRKEERVKKDEEREFQEELRRWVLRERTKNNARERERLKAETAEARRQKDREAAMEKYHNFDDTSSAVRRNYSYFYDHSAWVKKRMLALQLEMERDAEDRRLEEQELRNAPTASSVPSGPITISLGQPKIEIDLAPQQQQPQVQVQESEPEAKKEIPKDSESLFGVQVDWSKVDEHMVETKLRPVVVNAIIEFLGVQEEDLIDFILDHIKEHKGARELVADLSEPLEEDAEPLVVSVWTQLLSHSG